MQGNIELVAVYYLQNEGSRGSEFHGEVRDVDMSKTSAWATYFLDALVRDSYQLQSIHRIHWAHICWVIRLL